MSVVDYYTKLRKVWDELEVLMPTPQCTCNGCTCGLSKKVADLALFTQLMQFLTGLGEIFDHVRNQLLVMDPIPSVNRAYSMVQSVEKQRQVHIEMTNSEENIAMQVRAGFRKEVGFRGNQYKGNIIDKRQQYCTYCDRSGHTKDTCFKIHGTPDWYKDLVEQKRRDYGAQGRNFTACVEDKRGQTPVQGDTKEMLLQELVKLMRGTTPVQVEPQQQVNFAQFDDFTGMNCTVSKLDNTVLCCWIVDSGATNHMCANSHLLDNMLLLSNPTSIHLPDDSVQPVTHTCTAHLHHKRAFRSQFQI
ncbi:UNVERIFIED_CONTAM: hypothetical protein Sangu_0687600 [Sesamum angustifolium]|uniref:Retrovirus-related Pol polyprotein from transposon TNT 1-94-like beta-barrel domain-containing protein n=1 Tax=Sesamum angustifolium TaxID=2727405 RepID=A0AAW2PQ61_9LAMI